MSELNDDYIIQDGKNHFYLVNVYKCSYCDFLAMFSSPMIKHLKTTHPEELGSD